MIDTYVFMVSTIYLLPRKNACYGFDVHNCYKKTLNKLSADSTKKKE